MNISRSFAYFESTFPIHKRLARPMRLARSGFGPALLLSGIACLASCGDDPGLRSAAGGLPEPDVTVGQHRAALSGKDGMATITLLDQTVNRYAQVTADIRSGDLSIAVMDLAALDVAAGDLLMVIQMQGATLDFTDAIDYGAITNYNGAGQFEFVTVTGVDLSAGRVQVSTCMGGVRNAYRAAAHSQVVRVPQFTTLTVDSTGSIGAPKWNGSVGGILAIAAQTAVTLNGPLDVSGRGFRPGLLDNLTSAPNASQPIFRGLNAAQGGEKGEGIGGFSSDYDKIGGRYGRGAPGNGGGGGNSHNAGGGGGANAASGRPWRMGQGVMLSTVMGGMNAWTLDPGYLANGNQYTSDGGGGRGGYTYGANNQDALTIGPNQAAWGGDSRREVGGLGGRPLDSGVTQRLFLGGGGGAGDGNNDAANQGGAGGGLVFLVAPTVSGTAAIRANGTDGGPTRSANNDAAGGGGGGGTIVVVAQMLSGITVTASGGTGGSQGLLGNESEGPGGGGGGGFIALSGGNISATANGGAAGVSQSAAIIEFPSNGATAGNFGNAGALAAALMPLLSRLDCAPNTADLAVSISSDANGTLQPGSTVNYTVRYENLSSTQPVSAVAISDSIPPLVPPQSLSFRCTAQGGAMCPAAAGQGSVPPGLIDFPPSSSLTFIVSMPVAMNPPQATLSYSAEIKAPLDTNDPDLGNNSATSSIRLEAPDLAIAIADDLQGQNVQPGKPVKYTVTVSNLGPKGLKNAQLSDSLPAAVTIAAWTCTAIGDAICPAASGSGSLTFSGLDLGPGSSLQYQITTAPIPDNTLAVLTYKLEVQPPSGTPDGNPGNNQALSSHAVDNSNISATAADLGLRLSHTPQKLFPEQDVTYTAQAVNSGPDAVMNATVVFSVPAGSLIKTPAAGSSWQCTQAGEVAACVQALLAVGEAPPIAVVITSPMFPVPGGPPVAQGAISAAKNADPNADNDTATDIGSLPQADLSLAIERSPVQPQPGAEVTYQLKVTSAGPDSVPQPTLVFMIPAGESLSMPPAGDGWVCAQQGESFTCTRGQLGVESAPPLSFKTKLPQTNAETALFWGQVGAVGVDDPNLANNRAVLAAPSVSRTLTDLGITLSRLPEAALPGQRVTFTALAANLGPDTVYAPTVSFVLPPGAVVVQPAQGEGWACQSAADTVTCVRAALAPGAAPPIAVELMAPIEPSSNRAASTSAVAVSIAALHNADPNPANDHAIAAASSLPSGSSDLAVSIAQNPPAANLGEVLTLTIDVLNKGQDSARGVAVSIQLPPDIEVVQPAFGEGWRCVPNGPVYLCTRDRLAVGKAPPITLKVVTLSAWRRNEERQISVSVDAASASTDKDPTPDDNFARALLSGPTFKVAGGGFSCSASGNSGASSNVLLALCALLAALGRRRRHKVSIWQRDCRA